MDDTSKGLQMLMKLVGPGLVTLTVWQMVKRLILLDMVAAALYIRERQYHSVALSLYSDDQLVALFMTYSLP
jgi:hypothetical protein